MGYRKITLEAVVHEDDAEVFTQALNNALDRIEENTTVYGAASQTRRPWNLKTPLK